MRLCALLGIGSDAILAMGHSVPGKVTSVKRCWWLSVKTKPVRLYRNAQNSLSPHIISFDYQADGSSCQGKLYVPIHYRVPQEGETIDVFYDPKNPRKYACYAFGPAIIR